MACSFGQISNLIRHFSSSSVYKHSENFLFKKINLWIDCQLASLNIRHVSSEVFKQLNRIEVPNHELFIGRVVIHHRFECIQCRFCQTSNIFASCRESFIILLAVFRISTKFGHPLNGVWILFQHKRCQRTFRQRSHFTQTNLTRVKTQMSSSDALYQWSSQIDEVVLIFQCKQLYDLCKIMSCIYT